MKVKLLYKNLRPYSFYAEIFDKIVKDESDWWEEDIRRKAYQPTEKSLEELKQILTEKEKRDFTQEELKESHGNLILLFSIVASMSVKRAMESKRKKRIKEWRDRDRAKDKKILETIPFDNISCSNCKEPMAYQWSELYQRTKPLVEKVMFLYRCKNNCSGKIIFEDGLPYKSDEEKKCVICNSERKATVTKDSTNKTYIIYECTNCKSRQVETIED
jgi:hypothetical protein